MNHSPQSIQSPVSSVSQSSGHHTTASQPESTIVRGLGLICPVDIDTPSIVHDLPPSPQPSGSWSHNPQDFTQSSQPPDIYTDDFYVFANYSTAPNTAMISAQSPPELDYGHSTPGSNFGSHRGSVSPSYSPSESITENGQPFLFTPPRVKIEEARGGWYPHPGNQNSPYSLMPSPLSAPAEDIRHVPNDWQKPVDGGYLIPQLPPHERKKRRQATTPKEATHECIICGKLFKRSYNWKSHMETHNQDRIYPHPCPAMNGTTPCGKKFQRKTDLDRHNDSVHLKLKPHQCTLCGNRFARRDTMRRHTEDGCTKRFELGLREGSAIPARWPISHYPARNRQYPAGISPTPTLSTSYPHYNNSPEMPSSAANMPSVYQCCQKICSLRDL